MFWRAAACLLLQPAAAIRCTKCVCPPHTAVQASLPPLPANARYMQPSLAEHAAACNSTWGVVASVLPRLDPGVDTYDYVVVVDSLVIGPLVPPYVAAVSWARGPSCVARGRAGCASRRRTCKSVIGRALLLLALMRSSLPPVLFPRELLISIEALPCLGWPSPGDALDGGVHEPAEQ